jgi:hypothetical protein
MRNPLLKITAIIALGLGLNACTKSNNSTTTTTNTTPSMSATMNGTATTYTGAAKSGANYFTITGTSSNYTLTLYIKTPVSTGTSSLGAAGGSYAIVQTGGGGYWATSSTATGTLNISTYTTSPNSISGTFSFTAAPTSGANMVVTSGSFANLSF